MRLRRAIGWDTGANTTSGFSMKGSHYMPWNEFLDKSVGFWLGTRGSGTLAKAQAGTKPTSATPGL